MSIEVFVQLVALLGFTGLGLLIGGRAWWPIGFGIGFFVGLSAALNI